MDDPGTAWLILFLLGFVTDLVWTLAVRCTAQNRLLLTATFNAVLSAIALISTWMVIEQASIISALCYILGSFVGTMCTISIIKSQLLGNKAVTKIQSRKVGKKAKKSKKSHK